MSVPVLPHSRLSWWAAALLLVVCLLPLWWGGLENLVTNDVLLVGCAVLIGLAALVPARRALVVRHERSVLLLALAALATFEVAGALLLGLALLLGGGGA